MNADAVSILLVEDDQVDVMAVKRAFKELRIANPLVVAKDGVEALDVLRGTNGREKLRPPYLVLLDLNMPRMNGIEFLDALRNDPGLKNTIVFVLTTSDAENDLAKAYQKYISGYVLKTQVSGSLVAAVSMIEHYWKIVEFPT